jgi:Flp pilus assembly protein TadB
MTDVTALDAALDTARAALAEWVGAQTDTMSAGHALADALRGLIERVTFLEENRLSALETEVRDAEGDPLDEILAIIKNQQRPTELTMTITVPESLSVAQVARITAGTRYGIRA